MSSKINHLEIVLNKPPASRVYVPGEVITGIVNLRVTERIGFKCIRLVLFGKTTVQWEEYIPAGRSRFKHIFSDKEILVKKEIMVPVTPSVTISEIEQCLDKGDYSLPFQIELDENMPSSLEHAHARIRYIIRAIVDIPWAADVCTMISFTVISLLDLNEVKSGLKKPYELSEIKPVGCFPFCSKPLTVDFSVNKRAFVPGERIEFTIEIANSSPVDVTELRVNLFQVIRVYADASKLWGKAVPYDKVFKRKMGFVVYPNGNVTARSEELWSGTYRVPATCPTYTDSKVLKIGYLFQLSLNVAGAILYEDELSIPITIGTIPMLETVPESLVSSISNAKMTARSRSMSMASLPSDNFYSLEAYSAEEFDELPPPYKFDDEVDANEQIAMEEYKPFYIFYKDFSNMK